MDYSDRSEQERVRFDKLEKIRAEGFNFPNGISITSHSTDVLADEDGEDNIHTVAGRIVQMRNMGKAMFAHILDAKGKIQIYMRRDDVGEVVYDEFKDLDLGDIVTVTGFTFTTKTGEKSLHAKTGKLLVKALIPLPEKWHGLTDIESRYRYRYVDLIANPEVRDTFRKRAKIIQVLRKFLDSRDFLEVETPILHYIPGGAEAKPFQTYYNALSTEMYLRIALELPLKKLIVGGFDGVYEIGRNFRNEGLSRKHNPEFTMVEFYKAYATFEDLMKLTEELIVEIAQEVNGSLKVNFEGQEIDLTPPWPRLTMEESIHSVGGVSRDVNLHTLEGVHAVAAQHKIHLEEPNDWGRCLESLWGEMVEEKLINPTFITHHPFSISPLARKNNEDPTVTDRFELIINKMETANAFSELNDAVDQRERFEAQAARKASGNEESHDVDEDFLKALEYGLPPTAGEGIGIDRLTMLLTGCDSIRDVVLFPQLKPEVQLKTEGEQ